MHPPPSQVLETANGSIREERKIAGIWAGGAFVLFAMALMALFAPDILPFSVQKELAIALMVIGVVMELVCVVLVIKAQRRHGRERLSSVLQEAKKGDKPWGAHVMASQPQFSSKMNGAPRVEVSRDRIRLVQRRHFGWIFVGIPVALALAFLISQYSKKSAFRREPLAYLSQSCEKFEWFEWIAFGVAALLFLIFVTSGLLYVLWIRELDVDLRRKRFRFRTGLAGRCKTIELPTGELTKLRLSRWTAPSSIRADRTYEYWSLDLEIPGGVEPLNLGQWGRHEEALAEAERWQQWLPTLKLQAGD